MKMLDGIEFDVNVHRVRLYAEIQGVKQTPLQDFVFAGHSSS